ncbi:hypothetical protein BDV96DRAFT_600889 [Lophiotrema nucula]|uniref:DUF6590 domain-containing protein n=1 Tax=Lophiotrema nucula TaxID=690887 RepID=A0A6A5Z500_9PLEO|nr:hypothetical protein BDV96DRAFT_600889 [Lophiotrema nucula]
MTLSDWTWDPGRKEYYKYDDQSESYHYQSGYKILKNQEVLHPSTLPLDQGPIPTSAGTLHGRTLSDESTASAASAFSQLSLNDGPAATGYGHQDSSPHPAEATGFKYDQSRPQYPRPPQGYTASPPAAAALGASVATSYQMSYTSNPVASGRPLPSSSQYRRHSIGTGYGRGQPRENAATSTSHGHQQHMNVLLVPGEGRSGDVPLNLDLGPSTAITEPALLQLKPGLAAHRKLKGTSGETEILDPDFKIRRPGRDFFKKGMVFKVLWPELAGDGNQGVTIATGPGYGERVHFKIRWFVVVREGSDCCTCLSIQTYQRRGVGSKVKAHHAIIHTGNRVPDELPSEKSKGTWDLPMGESIKVTANRAWEKLDPLSRINFVKIYTVEHNVKVKDFGKVDADNEWKLVAQFNRHWGIPGDAPLPPFDNRSRSQNTPDIYTPATRTPGAYSGTPTTQYNPYLHQQPTLISPYSYPTAQTDATAPPMDPIIESATEESQRYDEGYRVSYSGQGGQYGQSEGYGSVRGYGPSGGNAQRGGYYGNRGGYH